MNKFPCRGQRRRSNASTAYKLHIASRIGTIAQPIAKTRVKVKKKIHKLKKVQVKVKKKKVRVANSGTSQAFSQTISTTNQLRMIDYNKKKNYIYQLNRLSDTSEH